MKEVQPIRDKKILSAVMNELKNKDYRNYILFITGINTGLRISDLLELKVGDVKGKSHIIISEQKTGKTKRFKINSEIRTLIDDWIVNKQDDCCLFNSRKGDNRPLSRVQAYRIINKAARAVGITDQIGTHTLRKTFGYHHYQQFKDVALLQDIFNHSAPSVTLRYIGINDDMKDKTIDEFCLL